MASLTQNEEFLKSAFKGYDVNSDGRVTVKEFKRIMARTGQKHVSVSIVFRTNVFREDE